MNLSNNFLEITFDDGVHTKLAIQNILREFSNINDVKYIKKIKWDSSLKNLNNFEFKDNFIEEESKKYKDASQFKQWIENQPQQVEQFRMIVLEQKLVDNLKMTLNLKIK